ncbi:bifunctional adenosylcobinamide kinase/adenosylcobinamide-phosphate guanylyltransferase [Caldimonas brevitalea]|uniref:Bifunctional adenosylcobalamin biosynthesis protein n=1 Tax=Caldimonas brevitalea TaxID=413882 RepID=A0A0G3BTR8_9BURK|nr:bifunctional adenosylcobinamide kinase/adenosylcobinamide-phosphate guanylyltransferase [Caldimonas brevitalea]AKJ29935.1 adenosylcobinamide kinase [Caldimonas brevitalea]
MTSSVHLILGGARSGKSRHAELLAAQCERDGAQVVYVATAWPGDDEMRERIAHHRRTRPARWQTVELPPESAALARVVAEQSGRGRCVLVDCLTLWLSQLLCPPPGLPSHAAAPAVQALLDALRGVQGQVLLVSNEIGWGVTPMGPQAREVVDSLGRLHQDIAAIASHVTLMVAGLAMPIKPAPWAAGPSH